MGNNANNSDIGVTDQDPAIQRNGIGHAPAKADPAPVGAWPVLACANSVYARAC